MGMSKHHNHEAIIEMNENPPTYRRSHAVAIHCSATMLFASDLGDHDRDQLIRSMVLIQGRLDGKEHGDCAADAEAAAIEFHKRQALKLAAE